MAFATLLAPSKGEWYFFSDLLKSCMEVFMDDFTVYSSSFYACLDSPSRVLDVNLTRSGSFDIGYGVLDDATSSEGR